MISWYVFGMTTMPEGSNTSSAFMNKKAAVLISRQPLRPSSQTLWVQKAVEAVRWVKRNSCTLLTSVGNQTWEMLVTIAARQQVPQILIIPSLNSDAYEASKSFVVQQFCIPHELVSFVPLYFHTENCTNALLQQQRDRAVIDRASIIIPISLRKGGVLETLITNHGSSEIVADFQIQYTGRTKPLHYTVPCEKVNEKITSLLLETTFITHWTRTCNGAWPEETLERYYSCILDSVQYPRSAFDTLRNILAGKKIIASARNIHRNNRVVCFSGLPPHEFCRLMRWRARYCQMSFEPYGIGIDMQTALDYGIQPVLYYDKSSRYVQSCSENEWLLQSTGKKNDWRTEKEYRYCGDFDFSTIPHDCIVCFCYTQKEALDLEKEFGYRVLSFID